VKRILLETLLILILSLFLALIYNVVSPTGLRILPRKEGRELERPKGNTTLNRDVGQAAAELYG
jgi:hypothetical protein